MQYNLAVYQFGNSIGISGPCPSPHLKGLKLQALISWNILGIIELQDRLKYGQN